MRQVAWLYEFAIYMKSRCIDMSFEDCWEYGLAAIENLGDYWIEETPIDSVNEEFSCWSD